MCALPCLLLFGLACGSDDAGPRPVDAGEVDAEGRSVMAACGQLGNAELREKRRLRVRR